MAITITGRITQTGKSMVVPPSPGVRGVFAGGATNTAQKSIHYISIDTEADASDFGDMPGARFNWAGTSNGISDRGIFGGGNSVNINIYYITISTTGNGENFGNLTLGRYRLSAASNGTNDRGVFFAGGNGGQAHNRLDYVTISTLGDATIFGSASGGALRYSSAGTSNGTNDRAVYGGGWYSGNYRSNFAVFTISTEGNAIGQGSGLTESKMELAATSNDINDRGVWAGGRSENDYWVEIIDWVTISSINHATEFGTLTVQRNGLTGASSGTDERGIFAAGYGPGYNRTNVIDYITISSASNATDFGDLLIAKDELAGTSNAAG